MSLLSISQRLLIFFTSVCAWAMMTVATAQVINGFDISNTSVDSSDIISGGPPKDGIPAIDQPRFIGVDEVDFLNDDDIVIGVFIDGVARAYPTRILIWHEIVNDTVANMPIAVTYCPLCATAMVVSRRIDGRINSFGVSGLLYQSDVLLYDRQTHSLWSQLALEAISGQQRGQTLTWLVSQQSTWQKWREQYPDGQVLSTDTGYQRPYHQPPYQEYFASDKSLFSVPRYRQELADKELVIGAIVNGQAVAYPIAQLSDNQDFVDRVNQQDLIVRYDQKHRHPQVRTQDQQTLPAVIVFWFAWQAFYPDTLLRTIE